MVLLVAPPAVDQARDFSDELPATVRELYSWPILGPRLEEADAAGDVEETIDELPARIDDETIAEVGERLLGGALSTIVVVITAIGVLADGEVLVRRLRAIVPPSRQARADEVGRIIYHSFGSYFAGSLLVAVLNGLVILVTGLLLGVPLAPGRRAVGHADQLHPADRRLPRRCLLRAARAHAEPADGAHRPRGVPRLPAAREQRRQPGHRRAAP